VVAFHLNDSKTPLGSRVDRHEHIGQGHIGLAGFRHVLRDRRWRNVPMVLETPKGDDLRADRRNLRVLRSLLSWERHSCRDRSGQECPSHNHGAGLTTTNAAEPLRVT
jgi:endonuclease IV